VILEENNAFIPGDYHGNNSSIELVICQTTCSHFERIEVLLPWQPPEDNASFPKPVHVFTALDSLV
jgi:hypothetical protein